MEEGRKVEWKEGNGRKEGMEGWNGVKGATRKIENRL